MENWGDFWVFWLLVLCILTIERDPILLTSFDTWGITIEQGGWFEGYHIPCSVTTFQHFKGLSCTFQHHPLSLQVSAWNRGVFHDHNAAAKNPILHYRKELWNPAKSKDKQLNHWCSFFQQPWFVKNLQNMPKKKHSNVAVSAFYRWNQWPSCAIWLWLPKLQTLPEKKGSNVMGSVHYY